MSFIEEARAKSENWRSGWDQSEYSSGLKGTDSMFSVRAKPWHGQGVVLERAPRTIAEALELSGLDWTVELAPIYRLPSPGAEPVEVEGNFATWRKDTGATLGVVGNRYQIVQNIEAFQFLDNLLGSAMHYETAGSLYDGRKVWVLARMPKWIEVAGERIEEFVLFSNTHDGSGAVKVARTPLRVVCQNTLGWGLKQASAVHSIRHTTSVQGKLHEAKKTLELTVDYYKQFAQFGMQLATEKMTNDQVLGVYDELQGGEAKTDRAVTRRENAKEIIQGILNGPTAGNAPGTKWCAANALCEYIDYYRPVRGDTDVWGRAAFEGAALKQKAVELVVAA